MAESNVSVIVVPESFRLTTVGAVTGQLWLRFEAPPGPPRAVPEAGWYDFPVPVLSWWLGALARATSGVDAELQFMDGPHTLTLASSSGGRLLFRGEGVEAETPGPRFEASLWAAAALTLAECERSGWSSRDILELRRAMRLASAPSGPEHEAPTCHRVLRRFWFPLPVRFGIGVTAASEVEARTLAAEALARYYPAGLELSAVIPDVDVSTLDEGHVLPNIGPPAVRGVWYPRLNS